MVVLGHHQIVKCGMSRTRRVNAEHQDRTGNRRIMRCSAVDRQGKAAGDVAHLRIFANTEFLVSRVKRRIRKHFMLPGAAIIPLRTRSDFEWAHIRRYVHTGYIESERGDPAVIVSFLRRGEVPVPWLGFCALKWRIESDLDDLVIRAQYPLCHGVDPRMSHDVDETADTLRVYIYIPTARSSTDGAAWSLDRLPKGGHHISI